MNTFFRYSTVVSLLGFLVSCSASSGPSIDPAALDASTDAAFEDDATDLRDSDAAIDPNATEMQTADAAVDANEGEDGFLSIDFSSWTLSENCPATELQPLSEAPFEIPSRPPAQNPAPTRAEILAELGSPLPVGNSVSPAANHQPGDGFAYDLWAEFGDDVTIHATIFHGNSDDFDDVNLNLWVTLDYEPVVATYRRWDSARETMREEVEATGLRRAVDQDVTSFDIVIPAERFEEPGAYEIGLGYEWSKFGGFKSGSSRRLVVYYGGFERHALKPCAPPVLRLESTDVEEDMFNWFVADDYILLLFDGMPDFRDVKPVVSPGQTIQFMASLYRRFLEPTPILAMPLLNGQPVGEPFMMSTGGAPSQRANQAIDGRQVFEVTFPEEPGEYEVLVATWVRPFEVYRYPDGTRNEDVDRIGFMKNNSSSFTFIVEPD